MEGDVSGRIRATNPSRKPDYTPRLLSDGSLRRERNDRHRLSVHEQGGAATVVPKRSVPCMVGSPMPRRDTYADDGDYNRYENV